MNKEKLKFIKPKNIKTSDKYSSNLYKFLKKTNCFKVYLNTKDSWDGTKVSLDWENIDASQILIGSNIIDETYQKDGKEINVGCLLAKNLSQILAGIKLYETGAYCLFGGFYPKRDFIEITEEFWKRYIKIGRCLFHKHDSWIQGNENQFTYINNTRRCNWCGKWETKKIIKKTKIERIKIWE